MSPHLLWGATGDLDKIIRLGSVRPKSYARMRNMSAWAAATAAARELIAAKHGAVEDKALVDQAIAGI